MILRLLALILLSALPQTKGIPQKIPLIVGKPGDNLTLTCPISGDEAGLFYWYKKMFGYMIETVAVGTLYTLSLQGQFDNPRFNVTKSGGMYFLNIKNVSHEDEGTYFCQSGAAYSMTFTNGTVLTVKGPHTGQPVQSASQLKTGHFHELIKNKIPSTLRQDVKMSGQNKQDLWLLVIVLGALLSCSVVVNLYLLSREHKPVCKEGTASYHTEHDRADGDQPSNTNDEVEALNYVALDFPSRRRERRMNNRELPQDCVYSS
ncbi:Ig kappa chain V-V region HP 91A3 [Collichthys lucidus]|uniref:Ig kappa chain V-V region HP 91A3 n=1 Tax=Collichthys lucidus TaxID=240159 RepID=A0A4U5UC71_COLLU|nr:Ig kappa chain V-V region HP 91A3 [Collichthys lucidus]